jgi:hypothetical protein
VLLIASDGEQLPIRSERQRVDCVANANRLGALLAKPAHQDGYAKKLKGLSSAQKGHKKIAASWALSPSPLNSKSDIVTPP